jgi:succinate dehydrogenase flavin-adding protein (antitoxin of CptAB toxin-antitoxin module)
MDTRMTNGPTDEQRRRIRWTAWVLGLTALGIYVAFIASSVMKAQP